MKIVLFSLILFISFYIPSLVGAETPPAEAPVVDLPPPPEEDCKAVFNPVSLERLSELLKVAFPFNLIVYSYNLLSGLSAIEPLSPMKFEIVIAGVAVHPLSFLSHGFFDYFFQFVRILLIVVIVFSLVRHLLEHVL